jgi:hypothetical protein
VSAVEFDLLLNLQDHFMFTAGWLRNLNYTNLLENNVLEPLPARRCIQQLKQIPVSRIKQLKLQATAAPLVMMISNIKMMVPMCFLASFCSSRDPPAQD